MSEYLYSVDDFDAEVEQQRAKYRWSYRLRWLFGWPKIAFLLGRPMAGWYLMRAGIHNRLCSTIGPFNTKKEARKFNNGYPSGGFVSSKFVLLWEEPSRNWDKGDRLYPPWYRVPARRLKKA